MRAGPILIPYPHTPSTASRNRVVTVVSCYAQQARDQKHRLQPPTTHRTDERVEFSSIRRQQRCRC